MVQPQNSICCFNEGGDAGEVMNFFFLFGDRPYFGRHYRDRWPEKW